MSDAALHALVIGATERLLLMLGWDKLEKKSEKPRDYQELQAVIKKRARTDTQQKALFQTPTLRPVNIATKRATVSTEWSDSSAFDLAATGTV